MPAAQLTSQDIEKIIVVIPAFNEAGKIGRTVAKISKNIIHKILVIDDGSTDTTAAEARSNGAEVISFAKHQGVGAAIRTGIDYARKNNYQIIVVMAGDDQDDPNEIPRLIRPLIQDNFLLVQGSRYLPGGKKINQPRFRLITTKLFSFLFRLLTGRNITDGTNGFRAFRTSVFAQAEINLWQGWLDQYELEPYLLYKAVILGLPVTEVPVTKNYPLERKIGYTKMIPVVSWWSILRPLFYLKMGIRK